MQSPLICSLNALFWPNSHCHDPIAIKCPAVSPVGCNLFVFVVVFMVLKVHTHKKVLQLAMLMQFRKALRWGAQGMNTLGIKKGTVLDGMVKCKAFLNK